MMMETMRTETNPRTENSQRKKKTSADYLLKPQFPIMLLDGTASTTVRPQSMAFVYPITSNVSRMFCLGKLPRMSSANVWMIRAWTTRNFAMMKPHHIVALRVGSVLTATE